MPDPQARGMYAGRVKRGSGEWHVTARLSPLGDLWGVVPRTGRDASRRRRPTLSRSA